MMRPTHIYSQPVFIAGEAGDPLAANGRWHRRRDRRTAIPNRYEHGSAMRLSPSFQPGATRGERLEAVVFSPRPENEARKRTHS